MTMIAGKINLEELSLFACFKFGSLPSFRLAISLFFQEKFCEIGRNAYGVRCGRDC